MASMNDTFTDTDGVLLENHTADTGESWAKHPSWTLSARIDTNRLEPASGSGVYYASWVPASAEYDVTAVVFAVATGSGNLGPCGRIDTTANTFYRTLHTTFQDKWVLYKVVAGASTTLGESNETLGVNDSRAALLELRDGAKKLFVEDVEIISSADNAITAAGRAGVWLNSPVDQLHIDSFTASDPAPVGLAAYTDMGLYGGPEAPHEYEAKTPAGAVASTNVSAGIGIGATVSTLTIRPTSIVAGLGIGATTPATKIAVASVSAGLGTLASIATLRISATDVHAGFGLGATVSVDDTPSASVTAGFGIGATVSTLAIRSTSVFAGLGTTASVQTQHIAATDVHAGIGVGASVTTGTEPRTSAIAGLGVGVQVSTLTIRSVNVLAGLGVGAAASTGSVRATDISAGLGLSARVVTTGGTSVLGGLGVGVQLSTTRVSATDMIAAVGVGVSLGTVASPVDFVLPFYAVLSSYPQVEGGLSSHAEIADAVLVSLPEDP